MEKTVLYDGSSDCHTEKCCPLIERQEDGTIIVHDPAKPESGQFKMSSEELKRMLSKSPEILANLSA